MTNPNVIRIDLEGDELTGTGNVLYDVIWFVQECMTNDRRLTGFIEDAKKADKADLEELFEVAKTQNEASWGKAVAKLKDILS